MALADIRTWYQKIGYVLSTSDHESFHLSVADGALTGSQPIIGIWPGSRDLYKDSWCFNSIEESVLSILEPEPHITEINSTFIKETFDLKTISSKWNCLFK